MNRGIRKLLALGWVVFALCAGGTALGQQCDVYRLGIPDFDQFRDGLIPNDGNSACIPTTGADWLAYIANHGFPDVLDGPRDWQSQANYDFVTDRIQILAGYMEVNSAGTDLTHYRQVIQGWLDTFYPGKFTVQEIGSNDNYATNPQQLYFSEAIGWLPAIAFGSYTAYQDPHLNYQLHYTRGAGHFVALASIFDACGATPHIWIRNPAGCCSGDINTQSPFVTETYDLVPITGWFSSEDSRRGVVYRTMWRRILHAGEGTSILDGLAVIMPAFGLSAGPHLGQVTYHPSGGVDHFNLTAPPPPVNFDLPGRVPLLGLAQEPAKPYAIVLGGNRGEPATLWRLNLFEGTFQKLAQYARPGPMVFGRHGKLYLYSGRALRRLDVNMTLPAVQNTLRGIDRPAAMTYDNATDTLLILTNNDRTRISVAQSDDHGGFSVSYMALPSDLDLSRGDVSMFVSPQDGSLWVATSTEDAITQLRIDAAGQLILSERVAHASIFAPRDLQITSRGTLLFTSDGILRELAKDPNTGEWSPVRDVPFVGQRVGDRFAMSRSLTVPAEYSGLPSDVNIVPPPGDGQRACPTDLNGDGVADHKDFRVFLTAFARDHAKRTTFADFNGDGVTNARDLTEFRTAMRDPICTRDKKVGGGRGIESPAKTSQRARS